MCVACAIVCAVSSPISLRFGAEHDIFHVYWHYLDLKKHLPSGKSHGWSLNIFFSFSLLLVQCVLVLLWQGLHACASVCGKLSWGSAEDSCFGSTTWPRRRKRSCLCPRAREWIPCGMHQRVHRYCRGQIWLVHLSVGAMAEPGRSSQLTPAARECCAGVGKVKPAFAKGPASLWGGHSGVSAHLCD